MVHEIYLSGGVDGACDVIDYCRVDSAYGTLEDFNHREAPRRDWYVWADGRSWLRRGVDGFRMHRLIALRKRHPALSRGGYRPESAPDDLRLAPHEGLVLAGP